MYSWTHTHSHHTITTCHRVCARAIGLCAITLVHFELMGFGFAERSVFTFSMYRVCLVRVHFRGLSVCIYLYNFNIDVSMSYRCIDLPPNDEPKLNRFFLIPHKTKHPQSSIYLLCATSDPMQPTNQPTNPRPNPPNQTRSPN